MVKISIEWFEEIQRRCTDIDDGRAELIPGEQVLQEAYELLERIRSNRER